MEKCESWLKDYLVRNSFGECSIIREAARNKGFTRKQVKDAKQFLGVLTHHQFDEDGSTPNWFWYLPNEGESQNG